MDFLFRGATPGYRGHQPPPTQSGTGTLSGIWCGLFDSGQQPVYKRAGRAGESAQSASLCRWWPVFPATPQYKTVPADDPDGCVPETPPPDCPDDDGEVFIADDGTLVW